MVRIFQNNWSTSKASVQQNETTGILLNLNLTSFESNGIEETINTEEVKDYQELRKFILDLRDYLKTITNNPITIANKAKNPIPIPMPEKVYKHFKEIRDKISYEYESGFNYYDYGDGYDEKATYDWVTSNQDWVYNEEKKSKSKTVSGPKERIDMELLLHMHSHPSPEFGCPSGFPPIYYKRVQDKTDEFFKKYFDEVSKNVIKRNNNELVNTTEEIRLKKIYECYKALLDNKKNFGDYARSNYPENLNKIFAVMGNQYLTFYGNGTTFSVYDLDDGEHVYNYIQFSKLDKYATASENESYIDEPSEGYSDDGLEYELGWEGKCEI